MGLKITFGYSSRVRARMGTCMFQYSNFIVMPESVEAVVEEDGCLAFTLGASADKLVVGRLPLRIWRFGVIEGKRVGDAGIGIDGASAAFQQEALEKLREALPEIDRQQCIVVITIGIQDLRAMRERGGPDLCVGNQVLNFVPKLLTESSVLGKENAALPANECVVGFEELGVVGGCSELLVAEASKNGVVVDFLFWGLATIYRIGLTQAETLRDLVKDAKTGLEIGGQEPALIAMVEGDRRVVDHDLSFSYVVLDPTSVKPAS